MIAAAAAVESNDAKNAGIERVGWGAAEGSVEKDIRPVGCGIGADVKIIIAAGAGEGPESGEAQEIFARSAAADVDAIFAGGRGLGGEQGICAVGGIVVGGDERAELIIKLKRRVKGVIGAAG